MCNNCSGRSDLHDLLVLVKGCCRHSIASLASSLCPCFTKFLYCLLPPTTESCEAASPSGASTEPSCACCRCLRTQSIWCSQLWTATMSAYLHMARQVLARPSPSMELTATQVLTSDLVPLSGKASACTGYNLLIEQQSNCGLASHHAKNVMHVM